MKMTLASASPLIETPITGPLTESKTCLLQVEVKLPNSGFENQDKIEESMEGKNVKMLQVQTTSAEENGKFNIVMSTLYIYKTHNS